MPTSFCRLIAVCVLASLPASGAFLSTEAVGQFTSLHAADNPTRGAPTNLFLTWAGNEPVDGLLVDLPAGWSLDGVTILRDRYQPVEADHRELDARLHRITIDNPLEGRHDIVLTLGVGYGPAAERIGVTPVVRSGASYSVRSIYRLEHTVLPVERAVDGDNRAASSADSRAQPLRFKPGRVPDLSLTRPFSVSFWIRTLALGEVVLSTWNGEEHRPYPIEIVVDAAGRLRSFHGRHGEHQSLVSEEPVADGVWHRIAITNSPSDGWTRLWIDEVGADSIYAPAPLQISPTLPLAVGGRNPQTDAYFDHLKPYSGLVDELQVLQPEEGGGELVVGFEEPVAREMLEGLSDGVRYEDSDLPLRPSIDEFRGSPTGDGVLLSWRSSDRQLSAFVVERSSDGRSFTTVERIPSRGGDEYEVLDRAAREGVAYYRIRQEFSTGARRISGLLKVGLGAEEPKAAVLFGNFPNPFNASTTITYEVREHTRVRLAVWDLSGQPVATLVDRTLAPGAYEIRFNAGDLPSGTYFVRLRTSDAIESHKMILTK